MIFFIGQMLFFMKIHIRQIYYIHHLSLGKPFGFEDFKDFT